MSSSGRYAKRGSWRPGPALVWRRHDFRESSRVITLLTREHGLLRSLAKGAHRATSPFLGNIDFLNTVEPRLTRAGDLTGLRLLHGVRLIHEPRALRAPARYLAAAHVADFATAAFPDGRADPPVFDLVLGGLRLLERCPLPAVPTITVALEVRFLALLGLLPAVSTAPDADPFETSTGTERLRQPAREWLTAAQRQPGRAWDRLPPPTIPLVALVGKWVREATERRCPLRPAALQALRP